MNAIFEELSALPLPRMRWRNPTYGRLMFSKRSILKLPIIAGPFQPQAMIMTPPNVNWIGQRHSQQHCTRVKYCGPESKRLRFAGCEWRWKQPELPSRLWLISSWLASYAQKSRLISFSLTMPLFFLYFCVFQSSSHESCHDISLWFFLKNQVVHFQSFVVTVSWVSTSYTVIIVFWMLMEHLNETAPWWL